MSELNEFVNGIVGGELTEIDYETELEGSNELFVIRPTIIPQESGFFSAYGIFNKATRVMEAHTRQLESAKEWARALKSMAVGEAETPNVIPISEAKERDGNVH
jgi:hypothetical protein